MTKFRKNVIVFVMFIASSSAYGQNSGFLGKKNIISVDTRLFIPLLYNAFSTESYYQYKNKNGSFAEGNNFLSRGLNLSIGRTLSNQVAFHVQGSVLDYKMAMEPYNANGTLDNTSVLKSTYFKSRAIGIMPIIEFTNSGGILPVGLSNQIGVGFYNHSPIKDDYLMQVSYYNDSTYNNETKIITEDLLFDYENYQVRSYSLMYKITLRLALTRSILLNLGFRYNLNITQFSAFYSTQNDTYGFAANNYREMVRRTQINNLASFETGLSFVF